MWIARVEINADGERSLRSFTSSAREENAARKSVLRRAMVIAKVRYPGAKSLEANILDFRLEEYDAFRLF